MSGLLVYTASGDDELAVATCVGEWTADRLRREGHEVRHATELSRATLRDALAEAEGFAAFSHGKRAALLDGDGRAVVDRHNIGLLQARWAWLHACWTAHELAALAVDAGATCFAGFDIPVDVGWQPHEIPFSLRATFEQLLTEVPSRLAAGVRDKAALRAAVLPLVDAVLDFAADHPDDAPPGIQTAAQQMLHRLVIRLPAGQPPGPDGVDELLDVLIE